MMRDKLGEQVKEFDAIIKPEKESKILFLGTPQCEDTILQQPHRPGDTALGFGLHSMLIRLKNDLTYNGNISASCVAEDRQTKVQNPPGSQK